MKNRKMLCMLMLAVVLLGRSPVVQAHPPAQTPTPPVTHTLADTKLDLCVTQYNNDNYPEALEICQEALSLYRQLNDRRGEARTLTTLGLIYYVLADYEQALDHCQQALPIFQEIEDQEWEARALNYTGLLFHYGLADYEQALVYYEQALSIARKTGDQKREAGILRSIGMVHRNLYDYDQALSYLQQALSMQEDLDSHGSAITLKSFGDIYSYNLSDYSQALGYYEQALPLFRQNHDTDGEAKTLDSIGAVYDDLGDYGQALDYYQQALTIFQEIGLQKSEAVTLDNLGRTYRALDNYELALAHFQQALAIERKIGDLSNEAVTLGNIGKLYQVLSDYEKALDYYQQALSIAQDIGDRYGEAATLDNIGQTLIDLKEYEHALVYLQQALAIRQEIGDRAGEATTLSNIGVIHQAGKEYDQALTYYQQALSTWQEIGNPAPEATLLNNIAAIHRDLGDYEQAADYFQRSLSIKREIGDRSGEAATLENMAILYEDQGQREQALEYSLQAIAIVESIHSEFKTEALKTTFATSVSDEYHCVVRQLLSLDREKEAFHYAERAQARTFLTLMGNQRPAPKGSEDPDLLQREAQLREELAALETRLQEEAAQSTGQRDQQIIAQIIADQEIRRQEYEETLTQLQFTNPEYAALISVNPLTLDEAQTLLREQISDVTLVSYFIGKKEIVIFVIGPDVFHVESVKVDRENLRELVAQVYLGASAQMSVPWQEPVQALYKLLIAPVQSYLPPANQSTPPRLGIVPHDLLHYLPFGLLYDGKNALLEGYTLFYAPSVSSLRFILDHRHPEADTLLALANPDAPGAPHLHYAVEEAQAVAALYETQPLIGDDATEARFKAEAGRYGLIHIAAHSDYNPANPLFSAILLQPGGGEDGRLETHEVFNLDLSQTDLVALSACQTHLGELSAGNELVGLERAFIRAGSPSLLTTLWPVNDAATAQLMERFYTHLRAGAPKAEALREAQMEMRTEHPAPFYWAGFVLVGDCGESLDNGWKSEEQDNTFVQEWWMEVCGCIGVSFVIFLGGAAVFLRQRRRGH